MLVRMVLQFTLQLSSYTYTAGTMTMHTCRRVKGYTHIHDSLLPFPRVVLHSFSVECT